MRWGPSSGYLARQRRGRGRGNRRAGPSPPRHRRPSKRDYRDWRRRRPGRRSAPPMDSPACGRSRARSLSIVLGIWMAAKPMVGFPSLPRRRCALCRRNCCRRYRRRSRCAWAFTTLKISWQYFRSGLSRVEPSAAAGVAATASRLATVSGRGRRNPRRRSRAPRETRHRPAWRGIRRASSVRPASDWLITAVGPPPWVKRTRAACLQPPFGERGLKPCARARIPKARRRRRHAQALAATDRAGAEACALQRPWDARRIRLSRIDRHEPLAGLTWSKPHEARPLCARRQLVRLAGPGPFAVSASGVDVALVRTGAGWRAFQGRCPHQGALLGEGEINGDRLVCRNHRWRFSLELRPARRRTGVPRILSGGRTRRGHIHRRVRTRAGVPCEAARQTIPGRTPGPQAPAAFRQCPSDRSAEGPSRFRGLGQAIWADVQILGAG